MEYGILTYPSINNDRHLSNITKSVINSLITRIPSELFDFNENLYILDEKTRKTIGAHSQFDTNDDDILQVTVIREPIKVSERMYTQINPNAYVINKDMNGYSVFLNDEKRMTEFYTHEEQKRINLEFEFRFKTKGDQYTMYEFIKRVYDFTGVEVLQGIGTNIMIPDGLGWVMRELYMDNSIVDLKAREENMCNLFTDKLLVTPDFEISPRYVKRGIGVSGYNMKRVFKDVFVTFPEDPEIGDPELKDEVASYYKISFNVQFNLNLPIAFYVRTQRRYIEELFTTRTTVFDGTKQLLEGFSKDSMGDMRFRDIKFYNRQYSKSYDLPILIPGYKKVLRYELYVENPTEIFNVVDTIPTEEVKYIKEYLTDDNGKSLNKSYKIAVYKGIQEMESGSTFYTIDEHLNIEMNECDMDDCYTFILYMRPSTIKYIQQRYGR